MAVTLAGLALVLPEVPFTVDLDHLLAACAQVLRKQYATPSGALTAVTGAALLLGVNGRAAYCVVRAVAGAARHRAWHRDILTFTAQPNAGLGAVVLDRPEPALYCLPGRDRQIVVTTGALALLDAEQLGAALAHERAHLRQRHDLVIAYALGLARAFPRVRLFRDALEQTTRLVELLADDLAIRSSDRLVLADALLTLSAGHAPLGALGATGAGAARVQRLITPPRPLSRTRSLAAILVAATLFLAPLSSVAGPTGSLALGRSCPSPPVASAAADAAVT